MELLTALYNNGLWISLLLFGLGAYKLRSCIVSLMRLSDTNFICSLPLVETQTVDFTEAGPVDLWLEGPHFTQRFGGLSFELQDFDNTTLSGSMVVFRHRYTGRSKVRLVDRRFTLPHPGGYVLRVNGFGQPRAGDADHRLIFMRPFLPKFIRYILGIVFSAMLTLASMVFFILRLSLGSAG